MARSIKSSHCGEEDSLGHILNGSLHCELKSPYIERCSAAGRRIVKGLSGATVVNMEANLVDWQYTMGNLGSCEKVEQLGIKHNRTAHAILLG